MKLTEIKSPSASKLEKLLAAFNKRQFKSLAVVKRPGDGVLASVKAALSNPAIVEVNAKTSALELANFVKDHKGHPIVVDFTGDPDLKVMALLKGMLDGAISYMTVDDKIKADLPHGVVLVSTKKLPDELAHRAVIAEATSATTSTAKTYQLKKYAGAGLGMWIKDAEADGFKTKKISGDADKDNDVWNAFDGNRKVGSFSDEERSGWLQAKL